VAIIKGLKGDAAQGMGTSGVMSPGKIQIVAGGDHE